MGMAFGDPDAAGTPVSAVPLAPPDLTDFHNLRKVLFEKVRAEPTRDVLHVLSEDRAKLAIVYHCAAMFDFDGNGLKALMTPDEVMAVQSATGNAKIKADVNACISGYDAKEVSANRKAAIEYCLQSNNYTNPVEGWRLSAFNRCMDTHDMLQAMCKRQLEQHDDCTCCGYIAATTAGCANVPGPSAQSDGDPGDSGRARCPHDGGTSPAILRAADRGRSRRGLGSRSPQAR